MLCCLRSLWTGCALSRRNCAGTPSYFLLSDFYLLGWLRKRSSQVFWQQWAFYHHCRIFRSYSGSPGTIANMIKKCCFQSCQIVGQCKVESNLQDGWIFLNVTKEVWKTPVYAVVVGREWLREKFYWGILCTYETGGTRSCSRGQEHLFIHWYYLEGQGRFKASSGQVLPWQFVIIKRQTLEESAY